MRNDDCEHFTLRFDRKTDFNSGAAGGIDSATARLCDEQGASLVLVDLLDED